MSINLLNIIKQENTSESEFAKIANIDINTINDILSGSITIENITLKDALKISKGLNDINVQYANDDFSELKAAYMITKQLLKSE